MICSIFVSPCDQHAVCIHIMFNNITSGHVTQNAPIGFMYGIFTYIYLHLP